MANKAYKNAEIQEQHLVNLAMSLAEKQLVDGTASTQVITHFLRLGEANKELEKERLRSAIDVNKARTNAMQSEATSESLYNDAIEALKSYGV